jgi:lipoprotein-anchoring transpeptidase ErfK/SrfK
VLDSFAGALPAIAIHGTNRPDTMGQERSNGCVRVPNELVELLATDLPLGTPVTIVSSKTTLGFGHVGDRFGGRRIY